MSTIKAPSYNDWLTWCRNTPTPEKDLAFFRTISWTNALIKNPSFKPTPTPSRVPVPGNSENAFFAKTIASASTIPHWQLLIRKALITPPDSPKGTIPRTTASTLPSRRTEDADCLLLLDLGQDVDGFPGVMHGGSLCAVLDEMLSLVVEFHRQSVSEERTPLYTVRLTTEFVGAVSTPGQVVVKAWLERREGRKWGLRGEVCDWEGRVCTKGEGVWVSAKEESL